MYSYRLATAVLVFLPALGACRGLTGVPDPDPVSLPAAERTVDERMDETSAVVQRMNRVQARAGRLEPSVIGAARLPDFGMLRRDEGVRLMMRDIGRAAESTGWAADRMQKMMRDPQMVGDPEMRVHLERMSEHLAGMADRLESGLVDLEGVRARLYTR